MVDTTDEWITTRTGIKERRIAAPDEATSDLAAKAALRALESPDVSRRHRPDHRGDHHARHAVPVGGLPGAAEDRGRKGRRVRSRGRLLRIHLRLEVGQQFIMSHTYDTVLVIGAEKLSSIIDWTDRNTCVLFGDGAGAVVLQNRPRFPRAC
jgi:3-oxoacyl-[acyl-carrier-protein] synthase-3